MILTIDIGNTTVNLSGIKKNGQGDYTVCFSSKMDTVHNWSKDEYLSKMQSILTHNGISANSFDGTVLCSVVPCLVEPIKDSVRMLTGKTPVLITTESSTNLIINVPNPCQIGPDRLADAAWAAERFSLPVVTVDMGTATTFNVVDEGRIFLGGMIAPGLDTGLRALYERAARLPKIQLCTPNRMIGRTTVECMLSGSVVGAAAMIDGITTRIETELGKPVTLIITGGLARYVESLCTHPHIYDSDLLSKGMALLYEWNAG